MSDEFSAQCPKCNVKLKLKHRLIGKSVPCPKCKANFVVQAPTESAEVEVEVEVEEDDVMDDDVIAEVDPPVRMLKRGELSSATMPAYTGRKPAPGKSHQDAAAGSSPGKGGRGKGMLALAGGGIALLLLVGGGAAYVLMSGGDAEAPVADPLAVADARSEEPAQSEESEPEHSEATDSEPTASSPEEPTEVAAEPTSAPPAAQNNLNLAYLPADAELYVFVDVAGARSAPFLASLFENPQVTANLNAFTQVLGIAPVDVDSLSIGMVKVAEGAASAQSQLGPGAAAMMQPGASAVTALPGTVVFRTSKAADPQRLAAVPGVEQATHADKSYFRIPSAMPSGPVTAAFFPEPNTAVLGTEERVKTVLETGGAAASRPELNFAPAGQHVLLVFAPRDPAALGGATAVLPLGGSAAAQNGFLGEKLTAAALGLRFDQGMSLEVRLNCREPAGANELQKVLDQQLTEWRNQLADTAAGIAPELRDVIGLAERALNGARASANGSVVRLTAGLSADAKPTLAKLPGLMMAYMMTGTMGGLGGVNPSAPDSAPTPAAGVPPVVSPGPSAPQVPVAAAPQVGGLAGGGQVTKEVANRPASEVLKELCAEAGVGLKIASAQERLLSKPVSIKLDNVSYVQAIEQVCAAVGAKPSYQPGMVSVALGTRIAPPSFAGPFVIAVEEVDEFVPHATGRLQIQAVAIGLPEEVVRQWDRQGGDLLQIGWIGDAMGRNLADEGPSGVARAEGRYYEYTATVPLRGLLRDVEQVQTVAGTLSSGIPGEIARGEFSELKPGVTQTVGPAQLVVGEVVPGSSTVLKFTVEGAAAENVDVVPISASGAPLKFSRTSSAHGGRGEIQLSVAGEPASAAVTLTSVLEPMELPFTITGIPLTSFAQMPEAPEGLNYGNQPQPVSARFVGFRGAEGARTIELRVVNHANKAVRRLDLRVTYVDAEGKSLDSVSFVQQGRSDAGGGAQTVLVDRNGGSQLEVPAWFLPSAAQRAEVAVEAVCFSDASWWSPVPRPAANDASVASGPPAVAANVAANTTGSAPAGKPDVMVESIEFVAEADDRITFKYVMKNKGDGPAQLHGPTPQQGDNVAIRTYFSEDDKLDEKDTAADSVGIANSSPELLQPGETYNGQYFAPLKPGAPKPAFLILQVDAKETLEEADETNNTAALNIPATGGDKAEEKGKTAAGGGKAEKGKVPPRKFRFRRNREEEE